MSKHLERDLETLQRDILGMGAAVEEAVYKAIRALQDRDPDRAREVIDGDNAIDESENHVAEACLKVLALHQPVAIDLRRVAAILAINIDLERMADLAVDIAERAEVLAGPPYIPVPDGLQRMTDLTNAMVRQALDAFVQLDVPQARRVVRLDDEIDRLNADVIAEIVGTMRAASDFIEPGLSLFNAVRHLERIADHATNIAENVVYLVDAEIVRHRPEAFRE